MTALDAAVPDARRIAVLRPNGIGDFMFALPALHALRMAYPLAHIDLLGKPWHRDFLHGRPGPVDQVIVLPPLPGIGLPPDAVTLLEPPEIASLRAARYDIALQMYGGGRYSNPFIRSLGARVAAGAAAADAETLERSIPYGRIANRRLELLQVAALVGAVPCILSQDLMVTEQDRKLAAAALPPSPGERIVVFHPGAGDPRRRWHPQRFAAVADALAAMGATIVLSAGDDEAGITLAIASAMRSRPADLAGRLTLSARCGMLERACMVVANDTGPLHLALALGKPAVGIFWLTNLMEAGPLRPQLLAPALSTRVHCPECGADNMLRRCPHDASFVDEVDAQEVTALATGLYRSVA